MSIESAKAFIERMKTDEAFAKQVESQKDKEERMKFVSEQGFNFSEQEVQQVAKEFSDDDLEKVVGGFPQSLCWSLRPKDIMLQIR